MTSSSQERECFVYIVLPGEIEFVTAGRLRLSPNREGVRIGEFVYGRQYRERANAVALDPVELRLQEGRFETARMGGFFGAIRDAMPDAWGRRAIEHRLRRAELDEFDYHLVVCQKSAEPKHVQFRAFRQLQVLDSGPFFFGRRWPGLAPMNALPLQFLVRIFAGWVNRHQQEVIEYLQEEEA